MHLPLPKCSMFSLSTCALSRLKNKRLASLSYWIRTHTESQRLWDCKRHKERRWRDCGLGWEGEVNIRVEYQRKKEKYSDLADIIYRNCVTFLRGTEVLQGKLKICMQERQRSRREQKQVSAWKQKHEQKKKGGEGRKYFLKPRCRQK